MDLRDLLPHGGQASLNVDRLQNLFGPSCNLKFFSIDAIRQLSEGAKLLMAYLMRELGEGRRNPLAGRVRKI